MSNRQNDTVRIYQIRIEGQLGQQWTDWFDGLSITPGEDGTTLLTGPVIDQSALQGLPKAKEKEGNFRGRPGNKANFLFAGVV